MCGIAGIVNINNSTLSLKTLKTFTDSMYHRGPDGSGYELMNNSRLGFGHRRLSVLDLTDAGKQPMYSPDQKQIITFNGEIYNFIEIRNELKSKGEVFVTDTDTEVIVRAYKTWGKDCFKKFNGMFVFAIYDVDNKELIIVRDRFGVKPLYYLYIPGNLFAFASETYAFKFLNGFNRVVNEKHLTLAMHQTDVLEGTDKTIYENIYQLKPGHYLTLSAQNACQTRQWWNTIDNLVNVPKSYNEQVETFKELFFDACKLRMRSDVSIASALSGGLDSSSVYCTLHKLGNESLERIPSQWQKAYVATFPNTSVDERVYAEQVVSHVNGSAVFIKPDYMNLVSDITSATKLFDGVISTPITSISDVYKAMKKDGITVSMDGHGVDEMLFGYNTYLNEDFYEAIQNYDYKKAENISLVLSGLTNAVSNDHYKKIVNSYRKGVLQRAAGVIKNNLFGRKPMVKNIENKMWLNPTDHALYTDVVKKRMIHPQKGKGEQLLFEDFHYTNLPINLRDFDRASMQHGIEIRMPFMDYRLVSYVFSLPTSSKYGNGFTKKILRDAMKTILPEPIRTRTLKIGIGAPMVEWFQNELKEYILDTVNSASFLSSSYWNGKVIRDAIIYDYEHGLLNKGKCNNYWTVINTHIILND